MHTNSPEIEAKYSEANSILIDTAGHQVKVGQTEIYLTLKEFDMLLFFVKNKGRVISRSELKQKVWGSGQLDSNRTIDVHICRLREKIEQNPHLPKRLISIRGLGYKLKE
jgi:two-component system response regulator RegX3